MCAAARQALRIQANTWCRRYVARSHNVWGTEESSQKVVRDGGGAPSFCLSAPSPCISCMRHHHIFRSQARHSEIYAYDNRASAGTHMGGKWQQMIGGEVLHTCPCGPVRHPAARHSGSFAFERRQYPRAQHGSSGRGTGRVTGASRCRRQVQEERTAAGGSPACGRCSLLPCPACTKGCSSQRHSGAVRLLAHSHA